MIVSGRGREDVAALVDLPDLAYAGSHGFDIAGPPPAPGPRRCGWRWGRGCPSASSRPPNGSGGISKASPGVFVEPKRFAVSVHFRLAAEPDVPRVERAVDDAMAAVPGLRKGHGKKLFELRPDLDWDKGQALLWLLDALGLDRPDVLPFYLGDDLTDEDAFRALKGRGVSVLVSEESRETAAEYQLRDTDEVVRWLERLEGRGFL